MADITMQDYAVEFDNEEGAIVTWYFNDGDTVSAGSVLCDVMVTKAQFEIASKESGRLTILKQPDEPIKQDSIIGRIDA